MDRLGLGDKFLELPHLTGAHLPAAEAEVGVKATDPDPVQRWQSISDFYAEFAGLLHWELLQPMVSLAAWVGQQPYAAQLYPGTSHEWLCVDLLPGYDPDRAFFSCGARPGGQFECELWASVGRSLGQQVVPLDEARTLFMEFVGRLTAIRACGAERGVADVTPNVKPF
jgi:hypothetical protein